MELITSFGYTDSVATKKSIQIPDLSYDKDFATTKETSDEVILTNVTSPLDQPERLRYSIQSIGNVYSGTGIEPSYQSVSKRGVSVLGQVMDTILVTPTDEGGCCCAASYMLPIEAHWVARAPIHQAVTAEMVLTVLLRSFSTAFGTGLITADRLNAILRGALNPRQ